MSSDEFRRLQLNSPHDPDTERRRADLARRGLPDILAVEGKVLGPGERSPGRNERAYVPDPEGKQLMLAPLEGRPIPGGTYGAFVLDGVAAGAWRTEHDNWRAVEMDHQPAAMWYATTTGTYADESISVKTTTYRLQRLAIGTRPAPGEETSERRQYWFWSSVPVWEMDPAAAVFILIDAEPWQTALCRVPDRH